MKLGKNFEMMQKKTKSTLLGNCKVNEIFNESLTLDFTLLSLYNSGSPPEMDLPPSANGQSGDLVVTAERVACECSISGLEQGAAHTRPHAGSRCAGAWLSVRDPAPYHGVSSSAPIFVTPRDSKNRVSAFSQPNFAIVIHRISQKDL